MVSSPVVAFTANDRPQYLKQALESWASVRGIEDATVVFQVEPGCPEVEAMCRSALPTTARHEVRVNERRMGELTNPWLAIEEGFRYSDYVIYAEDDDIVSTDALEYFGWAGERFRDRAEILTVNGFRTHAAGGLDEVSLSTEFTSWVFATWADRWAGLLRDDWDHDYRHRGWDWRIINRWIGDQGMRVVQPAKSRVQHVGTYGVHFREGDQAQLESRCFTRRVEPQQYREVPS